MLNVSSMACRWAALWALSALALGIRISDDDTQAKEAAVGVCPPAWPLEEHISTYQANASTFQEVALFQEWKLSHHIDCSDPVGSATVLPEMDPENPVRDSKVLINIKLEEQDRTGQLFLCSSQQRCYAEIRLKRRERRLVDSLSSVLNYDTIKSFHTLPPQVCAIFEFMVLLTLAILLAVALWLMYLLYEAFKEESSRPWGFTTDRDKSDPQLRLPKPADIMFQAFVDVLFFVIGCGLFVLEGERFFRTYRDLSNTGFVLVLAFPLVFGCAGVLRIFLAASRCHLYYESLRHGMLLKLQEVQFWRDYLLLWFWVGVIITVGQAAQVVFWDRNNMWEDLKALLVFSSPLYYMISSMLDIQHAESQALQRHCILALEGISKDKPVEIGVRKDIEPIEEPSFVAMARQRKDFAETPPEASGSQLNVTDLRWVGFVSLKSSGANRIMLLLFNPLLLCTLLCLAGLSCSVCFRTITSKPELLNLRLIGGSTTKSFRPSLHHYQVLALKSQRLLGVSAEVNPTEISRLSMHQHSMPLASTTGASLAEAVSLEEDIYPVQVDVNVEDTASTTEYRVQVLKYGVLPESITFSGTTKSGKKFHRCVPWGYLWSANPLWVPEGLKSLEASLHYSHYVIALPWSKTGGCFKVTQPSWRMCGQTSGKATDDFLKMLSGTIHGAICVRHWQAEGECQQLENAGASVLTTKNTSKFLPRPYEDSWEEGHFSVQLDMMVENTMFRILDSRSLYSPMQGITLTYQPLTSYQLFHIAAFSPGVKVRSGGWDPEISDHDSYNGQWRLKVYDSPRFKQAETMAIYIFSTDLDCYVSSLKVLALKRTWNLEPAPVTDAVCDLDSAAEVCDDGWKPTRGFQLPLQLFRDELSASGMHPLQLRAKRVCESMEGIEDPKLAPKLWIKMTFVYHPEMQLSVMNALAPNASYNLFACEENQCRIDLQRRTAPPQKFSLQLLAQLGPEHVLDLNPYQEANFKVLDIDQELCKITRVSRVKACGGKLNAMLLEVPLDFLPDGLIVTRIKTWIRSNRFWSPYPMILEIRIFN
ncbi:unnamed protein product [Effrenium voratum]|uniref:Uncharacterized protein n=1 Tax=Effrenium voratum TaxID=2562239 RepID=A0AA36JP97_9DINO|nr:unnamed protein product [Effrenium voratum]